MPDELTAPLRLTSEPDRIFETGPYPKPFAFNHDVARVFDDMVSRSVPMYRDVTRAVVAWFSRFHQDGGFVYDVGCSTGTTLEAIATWLSHHADKLNSTRLIGVDNSEAMLEKAFGKLAHVRDLLPIELRNADATETNYENASFVIINYTLQFIPVGKRLGLLRRVYEGLKPGGMLFLSEKLRSSSPEIQEAITHIYEQFKQLQGYSRTEIERKKEALDNVLVPLTLGEQLELLHDAGFSHAEPVLKWNNFASIVALKR